jgi:mannosyl-3-phosphoglycerate phosphatase
LAHPTEGAKLVVFTDLDGTLLDLETRSVEPALPAVRRLLNLGIPLVLCSAKTRSEIDILREELGIPDPFIVENGGAIFISHGYFSFEFERDKHFDGYDVIELGTPYAEIRARLERIREELKIDFQGFGDLSPHEITRITGLSLEEARRAKAREYDETLVLGDLSPAEIRSVLQAIERTGLRWTHGGVFYHAMGPNADKGKAARVLIGLYRREFRTIYTIGIGDSRNDESLLWVVDAPVLVQKPDGSWEDLEIPRLVRVEGVGPAGWRRAVEELLDARP